MLFDVHSEQINNLMQLILHDAVRDAVLNPQLVQDLPWVGRGIQHV